MALLLPLSGSNATAGKAIQNGFFGAYFSAVAGLQDAQQIRVYDVNETGGARQAYTLAVDEGAEFVVGPLLRRNVNDLARELLLPVPVLTLNFLPDDYLAPPGLFQFALAPEDEAASAARRAMADGNKRAVALVPNNEWGRRVLTSFSTELEALGGTLLDYRSYQPSNQDFSVEIEGQFTGIVEFQLRFDHTSDRRTGCQKDKVRILSPARIELQRPADICP